MVDKRQRYGRHPTVAELRERGWPTLVSYLRKELLFLPLEQMGQLLGCTLWSVYHWEHGSRTPSLRYQKKLLDVLTTALHNAATPKGE